jgi:hypothetical protein
MLVTDQTVSFKRIAGISEPLILQSFIYEYNPRTFYNHNTLFIIDRQDISGKKNLQIFEINLPIR